jgi:hypothetical protein
MSKRSKAAEDAVKAIQDDIEKEMTKAKNAAESAATEAARAMNGWYNSSVDVDRANELLREAIEQCGIYRGLEMADSTVTDSSIVEDVEAAEEDE